MKTGTLIVLLAFAICLQVISQPFHGGLLGGLTASQVDGDSYAGYNRVGLQGGVFVSTLFTGNLGARLEIKYTSRGARKPVTSDNTEIYKLNLHYVDLPVLLTLQVKKIGQLELGLVPGYLFAAGGEDDGGELPEDFLVDFRKFDLGTLMGLNLGVSPRIAVNLRYSYSIFSIRDLESAGAYYSWFGKLFGHSRGDFNNYLTFAVSYMLK